MVKSDKSLQNIKYREANVGDIQAVAYVHVRSWRESFNGIVPQSFLDKMSVEKRAEALIRGFLTGLLLDT